MRMKIRLPLILIAFISLTGCAPFSAEPVPGPDKQGVGLFYGAALGAGSGAVTGAQLSAGAGPGAFAGMGLGAVLGMFQGISADLLEEDQIGRSHEQGMLKEQLWVQEVLAEHYRRRLVLHPNRDIFPADFFFDGDSVKVRDDAKVLIRELARLTKERMPWSRIKITAYLSAANDNSSYASYVTGRRAEELGLGFIQSGFDPRRLVVEGVTIAEPLVVDPNDSPARYRQAVEITPLDY